MDYLSATQAAEILSISPSRVAMLIRDGRLKAQKFGNMWMIHKDDLDAFAKVPRPQGWKKGRSRKKSPE